MNCSCFSYVKETGGTESTCIVEINYLYHSLSNELGDGLRIRETTISSYKGEAGIRSKRSLKKKII
jgi:hypothetical protein